MSSLPVLPEALSCVHRHAIGCLLLNSSLCCRCADRRSVSELLPGVDHGDSHRNHVPSFNLSKYCASCREYWRTHSGNSVPETPLSQVLQSSVAAFNLPETTAEIESYRAGRIRNSYQSQGPPPGPRVHPRISLSHHCRNITNLRHELEAINTDISRVLSSLHDLRRELPVSRAASSLHHPQRPMENHTDALREPSTLENGNMPSLAARGLPGPNQNQTVSLIDLDESFQQLQESVNQSAVSQNMDTDTPGMATTAGGNNQGSQQMPVHLPQLPFVAVSIPGFVSEPAGHVNINGNANGNVNANAGAGANGLRTTMTPMEFDPIWPGDGSQHPWLLDPQMASMRVPQGFGAAGTAALYGSGLQRPARTHAGRPLQPGAASGFAPAFLPAIPVVSSAAPLSFSGQMQAQHVPDIVANNAFSQVQAVQPRFHAHPYVIHGGGAATFGYRHHHPGLGVASDGPSLSGPMQNGGPNSRRRARRPDDQGPNVARRPSPPRFEGPGRYYPIPGTVLSANDNIPPFPVLTEPRRSDAAAAAGHHRPQGSVRNLRAEYAAADMQMNNEQEPAVARRSATNPASDDANAPRGLDDPRANRPEPKEAEELQVTLECKVCMSQMVDTVLLPCGHAILCRWCADQALPSLRSGGGGGSSTVQAHHPRSKATATCPMCRRPVRQTWRIYLN
ncbi:hypothetical protein VTN77DRAFT_2896 [Rasamsonia byssochlamydoides]|uniref:uncharacterized protein n=1 Tax=Rasamsonia byssochlamydoides TaxID=89139 RepID=UPI00374429F3